MNRIEFMTTLASLLQDIPVVERREAMQYYNDYFDDAGAENEQQVIKELESPQKVAEKIRVDFGPQNDAFDEYVEVHSKSGEQGSYSYNGNAANTGENLGKQENAASGQTRENPPRTSRLLKVILIIALIFCAAPIALPGAIAVLAIVLGCVVGAFALFFGIVIAAAVVAVVGVIMIGAGLIALIPEFAVGLAMIGIGLVMGALGAMGTVASIKLCILVVPAMARGIVRILRWPFRRKAVA